jgi:hypothetical protein
MLTTDPKDLNDSTFNEEEDDQLEDDQGKSSDLILTLDENAGDIDNIINANNEAGDGMLHRINTLVHLVLNQQPPIPVVEIPADIPAPDGLTELGITHWNRDKHLIPDWRDFPKQNRKCQGLKNLVKMLNSDVGFQLPEDKKCFKSRIDGDSHWMDWRDLAGIRFQYGKWKYNAQCNGECLKNHVSIPVHILVDSGERCHNPRCSNVPTLSWLKNHKSYCSLDCIDGYQE